MTATATPMPTSQPSPGRPRNAYLDEPILLIVRELLSERGYEELSVREVTRRAGVHARTIVRRWPTKAALVAAAVMGGDSPNSQLEDGTLPSGDLRADLRHLVVQSIRYVREPAVRAAMPVLLGEVRIDKVAADRVRLRQDGWATAVRAVLDAAVRSGDLPEDALRRSALLPNLLSGTTFDIGMDDSIVVNDAVIDELTDLLVAALRG